MALYVTLSNFYTFHIPGLADYFYLWRSRYLGFRIAVLISALYFNTAVGRWIDNVIPLKPGKLRINLQFSAARLQNLNSRKTFR